MQNKRLIIYAFLFILLVMEIHGKVPNRVNQSCDYSAKALMVNGVISTANQKPVKEMLDNPELNRDCQGAIIRFDDSKTVVYLVFPADEHFGGASHVLDVLEAKEVKASFFLTGRCIRNHDNRNIIDRIVDENHYLGPHSDDHLLYCDWEKRDSLMVSHKVFKNDLKKNLKAIEKKGVPEDEIRWFLPPYEWYNSQIVNWSSNMGIEVVSFTPGIGTNADYTTPEMSNYRSSEELLEHLWYFEETEGLNGALLLIHPGVHPDRKDKFYNHLAEIIDELRNRGYCFEKL
ncbi:MAG: cellulase [Anaerophaga sp.]|jgi:peptidoglycan/xylan/chitin deacetylase (PgdA/CDA1 family)|nr:cellulase [Anaerophaga sp.]